MSFEKKLDEKNNINFLLFFKENKKLLHNTLFPYLTFKDIAQLSKTCKTLRNINYQFEFLVKSEKVSKQDGFQMMYSVNDIPYDIYTFKDYITHHKKYQAAVKRWECFDNCCDYQTPCWDEDHSFSSCLCTSAGCLTQGSVTASSLYCWIGLCTQSLSLPNCCYSIPYCIFVYGGTIALMGGSLSTLLCTPYLTARCVGHVSYAYGACIEEKYHQTHEHLDRLPDIDEQPITPMMRYHK